MNNWLKHSYKPQLSKLCLFLVIITTILSSSLYLLGAAHKVRADSWGGQDGKAAEEIYKPNSKQTNKQLEENIKANIEGEKGNSNLQSTLKKTMDSTFEATILSAGGVEHRLQNMSSLTEEEKQIAMDIYGNGVIGDVQGYIADLYKHQPASTTTYLADVFQSAKIIPQAQAQGLGFASLDPILLTWKTFRNVAYLFFVIIFVVIGFMIMLRHKISGQTVVTAQQAIPNIIVALLFVTFSYAIAGLLIDLMYLLMYLTLSLFNNSQSMINMNIWGLAKKFVSEGAVSGYSVANDAISTMIESVDVAGALSFMGGLTVGVIMVVAVIYGVVKLFFELVKSYISIIVNVAFAPLILMIGALPGQNTFNGWIRNLIGNLAAFPAVLLFLIMQDVLTSQNLSQGGFMPPFLINQGISGSVPAIVGLGLLLAIPEIVKKVKDKIGVKEGVMSELGGAAWDRFKQGADVSKQIPVRGLNAGLGAVTGAAGANRLARQEDPGRRRLWTMAGALGGGAAGGATNLPTKFLSSVVRDTYDATSRGLATQATETVQERLSSKAAEKPIEEQRGVAGATQRPDTDLPGTETQHTPTARTKTSTPKPPGIGEDY